MKDHITASQAEPGNLKFEIVEDRDNPAIFHLDEAFEDAAAFAYHQERGSASPWGVASKHLVRDFTKTED